MFSLSKSYRFLYLSMAILSSLSQAEESQLNMTVTHPIEFVILIASYNNEQFAVENLRSACFQKSSRPYEVIYVNDCSTDNTHAVVEAYVKEHGLENRVTIINNEINVGQVGNYYNIIHSFIPDHKIVVLLDGDDKLAHDEVLSVLEKHYSNPNTWMTHGSRIIFPEQGMDNVPESQPYPSDVILERLFRKSEWVKGAHLISFKACLYKKIRKEDLMYQGKFLKVAGDVAFLMPIFEMCSPYKGNKKSHIQFIPEVLYLYRVNNPISDFRIYKGAQSEMNGYIRGLQPYESLESL